VYLDDIYASALESAEFLQLLSTPSQIMIIDLGAGQGSRLVRILSRFHPRIIAVDWFPSFIEKPLHYEGEKVVANVLETGLTSHSADLVVSAHVTLNNPMFAAPEIRRRYIMEIVRLMKPGGLFWGEEKDLAPDDFQHFPQVHDYYTLKKYHIHLLEKS